MAVTKEYRCMAHGDFESSKSSPLCPHGCDTVERVFLTPPAFRSERTGSIDRTLQKLAADHGMSDISNAGGVAAKRQTGAQEQRYASLQDEIRKRYGADGWGNIPKGGSMNVKTKEIQGTGPGVAGALSSYHGRPDNVLSEVAEAGALKPKPVLVKRDHEKLSVTEARAPA